MQLTIDLNGLVNRLSQAKVVSPWRELRLLLCFIQQRSYEDVFLNPCINQAQYTILEGLVERRMQGEPLSKIVGKREFWGLPFIITPHTLDPRPDSETLVEAVLNVFPKKHSPLRFVDFGTGSGCLLLSLLYEYAQAFGIGVDKNFLALTVAQENADRLGLTKRVSFYGGDWAQALQGKFDVLMSNPPYIAMGEMLDVAVCQYDPPCALYGGRDGLQAYKNLLPQMRALMHPESWLFLEIGQGQGHEVRHIASGQGLLFKESYLDLAGIERVLAFQSG